MTGVQTCALPILLVVTSNHKLKDALRLYEAFGFRYVEYSDKWFQLSDIRMELEL